MPYKLLKGLLSIGAVRSASRRRHCARSTIPASSPAFSRNPAQLPLTQNTPATFEPLESRTLMSAALPQVGVNLDAITYYSPAWTFTDAFKQSAPFVATPVDTVTGQSGKWGQGGDVSVDARGWPTELKTWTDPATGHTMKQRLDTLIFRDIDGQYPGGTYHLAWEGTGEISFGPGAQIVSRGPDGRSAAVNVDNSHNGIVLHVDDMSAADPVRNIHLWMPDYNGQSFVGQVWEPGAPFSPFHPRFLELVQPFETLRFMPWQRINGNVLQTWDQRRTIHDQTQMAGDKRGIAFEYMVELARVTGADAWINLPHMADDAFVANMATMFRDGLPADQKIYVEWSNEIWNSASGFTTWRWLDEQTKLAENAGKTEYDLAATHINRDFGIVQTVFTGQESRIVRVIAGQSANRYVLEQLAENVVEQGGTFDAMSVAGYIGIGDVTGFNASTTPEQVAQQVLANVPGTIGAMARAKSLAEEYAAKLGKPIQFVTYEGGQSLDAGNAPYRQAFYDAQADPHMYEAYRDLMQGFHDIGGDLFMHFTLISENQPSGSWGALQYMTQTPQDAPKYRALLDADSGAIYRNKVRIEIVRPVAAERGTGKAVFRVTRMGDRSGALDVTYQAAGTAAYGVDYGSLSIVRFAAGEASKLIEITPTDDAEIEDSETVILTLTGGGAAAAYDVDALRSFAQAAIADDEAYAFDELRVRNGSFEGGSLADWKLEGRSGVDAASRQVANSPAAAHDGTHFAWSGGSEGRSGGGDKEFTLSQRLGLRDQANKVDNGGGRITVTGWGAGGGRGLDAASIEIRFYDTNPGAAAGTQIGATYVSNRVTSESEWAVMAIDAEVPKGARSVEIRLVGSRRSGDTAMNVGFDDVRAAVRFPTGTRPLPPQPPPTPTDVVDVGPVPIPGDTTVDVEGSSYTLTGAGSVGGTSDALHFAYQARTGNFDIKVRVSSLTSAEGANGRSMAGLMARGSLLADAPNVFIKANAQNSPAGFGLTVRGKAARVTKGRDRGVVSFPDAWVRLQRVGNTFIGYQSTDGITWRRVGKSKVKLGPTVLFGMAAASQSNTAATTAHFDGLSEVKEAWLMVGKRRVLQRTAGRSLPRDPRPVTQATIALPREEAQPRPSEQPQPRPQRLRPDWAKQIRPDRDNL